MGTVAADEKQTLAEELAEARALVEQGEVKAALKLLERIRRVSLAEEQVPALEEVLALGEVISRGAEGKLHDEAERLLYSARQNTRFIGYKQALAEGREGGVDWFAPPIDRPVSVSDATVGSGRRLGLRRPRYERRVWLKWLGLTVLVFVPAGALLGLLMPVLEYGVFPRVEPPPADWDSPRELAKMVPVGIWLVVVPWTAIYFERVNTRYRSVDGGASSKTPGFGLAVTALVLATLFFLWPVTAAVAAVAWWRISATGTRYARGSAMVATASVGAVLAAGILVGWYSWSSNSDTGAPASTTATSSSSGLQRVVVGDLSIRVPAEWRSYDYEVGSGWKGVSLSDPRHEPSDAVIFGFYSQEEPGATTAQMGKELAASMRTDKAFSAVRQKPVVFPSGIRAHEVRYSLDLNGRGFTGVSYAFVVPSSSGTRGYLILYRAIDSQAGHMAQFRASAQSIKQAKRAPTTSRSASGLKRIVVGGLAIRVPAEWQSSELPSDIDGLVMFDPRHEPPAAVTFSCYYIEAMPLTTTELGKAIAHGLRADKAYSAVREKLVTLPSGIKAYELRFNVDRDGQTFTGVEYFLVAGSGSDARQYNITYEAIASQAGRHLAQFQASARSIDNA